MASMQCSPLVGSSSRARSVFAPAGRVARSATCQRRTVTVQAAQHGSFKIRDVALLSLGAATLLAAQHADAAAVADAAASTADAAQQVVTKVSDNRIGILAALFLPAIGWVGYNIAGPAQNQLQNMSAKQRSIATGLGLGAASLLLTQQADAAQEVAELAAGDNRLLIIATLLLPVGGWVLFNIGGPALNQLNNMSSKSAPNKPKRR